MKIMMIDDDRIVNFVHEAFFKKHLSTSEVSVFMWAEEALHHLGLPQESLPDVILLDINMPHIDGWDFLEQYILMNLDIPVYIFTSSIDENDRARAKNYSCVYGFFIKPMRSVDIVTIINKKKEEV